MKRAKIAVIAALGLMVAGGAAVCAGTFGVGILGLGGGAWMVGSQWENGLRLTLGEATGGEVTFDSLSVGLGHVTLRGVEVHRADQRLVRVDKVVARVGPSALSTSTWSVDRVDVTGVHADVRLGPDGWELPERTMALLQAGGSAEIAWPAVAVGEVHVTGIEATATSADGVLAVIAGTAEVRGIQASMDPGLVLKVAEARVDGVDVTADGQPVARVESAILGADGVARVAGASVHASIGPGGVPRLPPVVADYSPRWMGGRLQLDGSAPWLGISLAWLPWQPARVEATDVTVDLVDGALVVPAVRWSAAVSKASAGPLTGELIPLSADLRVAQGAVHADGTLRSDGKVAVSLDLDDGAALVFVPYIQESLDHYGLTVEAGVVSADVETSLDAPSLAITGKVTASELKFARAEGKNGVLAVAANAGVAVLGKARTYTLPVRIQGNLDDPGFRPVQAVLHGLEDAIFGSLGGSVRGATGAATGAVKSGAAEVRDGASRAGQAVAGKIRGITGKKKKDEPPID